MFDMLKIFKRDKIITSLRQQPHVPPPASVDPLRQPRVTSDGWTLIHHGDPPYGYDTEYYANEAPLDEHHTMVRLVPHSSCKHEYRTVPGHGVAHLTKFDPPTYDKVTVKYIKHNHSESWECGVS